MAKYRHALAQATGAFFLTDGGLETTLIFVDGQELPHFAAFHLLRTPEGEACLLRYFRSYAELARRHQAGVVLETPTWRASRLWGQRLGYADDELAQANRRAVGLLERVRAEFETPASPVVISGCIGPCGDGYRVDVPLSAQEAEDYHAPQIAIFATTAVDLVTAMTLSSADEAIGVVTAARRHAMPAVISLTVETDGRLPSGQPLGDAIRQIDDATSSYTAYYMLNCAHPSHFRGVLDGDPPWAARIRGLRANASARSHAELDEATELDDGDPQALAGDYAALRRGPLRHLNVLGGCCGTDLRHVEQLAQVCRPLFRT